MINLRYHIVSITAIFLALAIGIAMGSTFIDKATVAQLKRNIDGVEAKANRVDADNAGLRGELASYAATDKALASTGLPKLLEGTLRGVPVLLVVGTDVGDATVKRVQTLVLAAGAAFEGTLRLDDRLRKLTPQSDDVVKLASILDSTDLNPLKLLGQLSDQLGNLVALLSRPAPDERSTPPGTTLTTPTSPAPAATTTTPATTTAATSTTTAPGTASTTSEPANQHDVNPPLVQTLIAGGFLDFEAPAGDTSTTPKLVAPGQRVIVLGAPRPPAPEGSVDLNASVLRATLQTAARTQGLEVVAASSLDDAADTTDPPSVRSLFVAPLRGDKTVASRLSTVDDLDRANGLLALIWAVKESADGRYGQYGIGRDASAVLPKIGP